MKPILVLLCIITQAYTFPTMPTVTDKSKPCCVGEAELVYRGQDTRHGVNVFVFTFPSVKEKSKPKKDESYLNTESGGGRSFFTHTEDEETISKTDNPINFDDNNITLDKEHFFPNETLDVEVTESKIYSVLSKYALNGATLNDVKNNQNIELNNNYEKREFSQNDSVLGTSNVIEGLEPRVTEGPEKDMYGDQAKDEQIRDIRRTDDDISGYFSTEGSAYMEIPDYNTNYTDLNTFYFHSNYSGTNISTECTKYNELCKHSTKHKEENLGPGPMKEPDISKSVAGNSDYGRNATGDKSNKGVAAKGNSDPKSGKDNGKIQFDKGKKNNSGKKYSSGKIKFSRGHKRKIFRQYGVSQNLRNRQSSESSSESTSDSSQAFD